MTSAMQRHPHPYRRLSLMSLLSFSAMYVLMYAMVDVSGNVFANLNQAYMAGLMTAPMVLIELGLMGQMYPSRRWSAVVAGAAVAVGVACFVGIRWQVVRSGHG